MAFYSAQGRIGPARYSRAPPCQAAGRAAQRPGQDAALRQPRRALRSPLTLRRAAVAKNKVKRFGILTSGGDCPGLNAAIRGVAKAASSRFGMEVIGISNGYRGLINGDARPLSQEDFSGILTLGGTILGSSREKPFKACDDGNCSDARAGQDKPERIFENVERLGLDALVVLGGNGT
ncbi:MAG TPA: hypothetical protein DCG47_04690, partial [Spirochaetaceae bacterium]|nr:hypothetical protein [Spirochaetaceae bacterium]